MNMKKDGEFLCFPFLQAIILTCFFRSFPSTVSTMQLLTCLSLTLSVVFAFPTAEYLSKLHPSVGEVQDVAKRLQHEKRLIAELGWKPIDGG